MVLDDIIKNKEEVLAIFARFGVTEALVIGSVSRRTERPDSDIDFVANFPRKMNNSIDLQQHTDLHRALQTYFHRPIHLGDYEQIRAQYPNAIFNGILLSSL